MSKDNTPISKQVSFAAGQIAPEYFSRNDLQQYKSAAKTLKNVQIDPMGLAVKRKGTEIFSDFTLDKNNSDQVKIIEFEYIEGKFKLLVFYKNTPTDTFLSLKTSIDIDTAKATTINLAQVKWQTDTKYVFSDYRIFYIDADGLLKYLYWDDTNSNIAQADFKFDYAPTLNAKKQWNYTKVNFTWDSKSKTMTSNVAITDISTYQFLVSGRFEGYVTNDSGLGGQPLTYGVITAVSKADTTNYLVLTINRLGQNDFNATLSGANSYIGRPICDPNNVKCNTVYAYEDRIWLGGFELSADLICASRIGDYLNFDIGTGYDADAIVKRLDNTGSGKVKNISSGKTLLVFTENKFYSSLATSEGAISPKNFDLEPQSGFGISDRCIPISYINDVFSIARDGKSFLKYTPQGDYAQLINVSVVSAYAYNLINDPQLYVVTDDNTGTNYIYGHNKDNSVFVFQYNEIYQIQGFSTYEMKYPIIDICTIFTDVYLVCQIENAYKLVKSSDQYYVDYYNPNGRDNTALTKALWQTDWADGLYCIAKDVNFSPSNIYIETGIKAGDYWTQSEDGTDYVEIERKDSEDTFLMLNDTDFLTLNGFDVLYFEGHKRKKDYITYTYLGECETYDVQVETFPLTFSFVDTYLYKSIVRYFIEYYESGEFSFNNYKIQNNTWKDIINHVIQKNKTDIRYVQSNPQVQISQTCLIQQDNCYPLNIKSIGYQGTEFKI